MLKLIIAAIILISILVFALNIFDKEKVEVGKSLAEEYIDKSVSDIEKVRQDVEKTNAHLKEQEII